MEEPVDSNFESDFDSVDCSQPEYVYDGSRYWLENGEGEWVYLNGEQFKRHLKGLGVREDNIPGKTLTGIEYEMNKAEIENRIKWAGALAGHWSGFKQIAGNPVLVTQNPSLIDPIEPAADAETVPEGERSEVFGEARGFPVLARVLKNLLSCDVVGERQVEVFTCYVRHTLDCLYGKFWAKSPMLAIAGEVKCGKSLLIDILAQLFAKKVGKPYDWFIGKDNFNGELLESVLLVIDDEVSDTNPKSRALLGDRCKNITAAAGGLQRIRGIQKEGIGLQPLWRIVLAVNDTPDKLMVLPPIEEDNFDKMILLKAYRREFPMASDTPEEQRIFWMKLMSELPHFVWWVRNRFTIPDELKDRFGVKWFHHPDVVKGLSELSSEMQLWHYLEKTLFASNVRKQDPRNNQLLGFGEWVLTPTELYSELTTINSEDDRPCLNQSEAQSIPKAAWLGQRLARLAKIYPKNVMLKRTSKARYWHLVPPGSEEEEGVTEG